MALTTTEISNLVVSMFDAAAGAANIASLENYVATQAPTYSLADLANDLAMSPLYTEQYNGMDNAAMADALASQFGLTKNIFGLYDTQEEQDAYNFFKDSLDAGSTTQDLQVTALTYLSDPANAASFPVASATLANKEAVAQYYSITQGHSAATVADLQAVLANVTDSSASVTAAEAAIDSTAGQTFDLTSGADSLIGTALNDTFQADINQVAQTGAVANTLATGDSIDGGAGNDTLNAQLTVQNVDGWYTTDVQPTTTSVENVQIESQDYTYGGGTATLDAKNMTGVDKIGSSYSDGDLAIENLTTLADNGDIRSTSDMTVTMDHTDNFNHDGDASDLTVLFDEDYLNTTTKTSGSSLTLKISNVLNMENGANPVAGFQTVNFTVGTTAVAVDVSAVTSYADIRDAINTQLAALGLDTVSATLGTPENAGWSQTTTIGGVTYPALSVAGQLTPIIITNSASDVLVKGVVDLASSTDEGDLNAAWQDTAAKESTNPISINVELDKVGRDGEGGNLIIGGKQNNSLLTHDNTAVDTQNDGIDIFNITVKGDEDRPSNLGMITSTNGALNTVNVASEAGATVGATSAALTVRGEDTFYGSAAPFGGTLDTFNANQFVGDLYIGQVGRAQDIDTFTATGGGNVTLYANNGAEVNTITTGSGTDYINVIDTDNIAITTGAGNDTTILTMGAATGAATPVSHNTVNMGAGNDTLTITNTSDINSVSVNMGSGNDIVYGNALDVSVDAGAGNDTVYFNNLGDNGLGTVVLPADSGALDGYSFLLGRTVKITFSGDQGVLNGVAESNTSGFEVTTDAITAHAHNYITTYSDLVSAVQTAVANDAVLSHLITVADDGTVTSLVDGDDNTIEFEISDKTYSAANNNLATHTAMQAEYQGLVHNSTATVPTDFACDQTSIALAGGSDSTVHNNNFYTLGISNDGNDVISLSTDHDSVDTIAVDAAFGDTQTIVNFTPGQDVLDFSHYLQSRMSPSGSQESSQVIAETYGTDHTISANEVTVLNFGDGDNTTTTGVDKFGTLSASNLTDLFNNLQTDNYADVGAYGDGDSTDLVNGNGQAIIMVENDTGDTNLCGENTDNLGEYKVFSINYTVAAGTTEDITSSDVSYLGTMDFGASLDSVGSVAYSVTNKMAGTFTGSTESGSTPPPVTGTGNDIAIPVGTSTGGTVTVAATADDDNLTFDLAAAQATADNTQVDVTGFDTAADMFTFDLANATGPTTLDQLNGQQGVVVQEDPFAGSTLVTFGPDANGDVISITIAGVADASLVNVDVA